MTTLPTSKIKKARHPGGLGIVYRDDDHSYTDDTGRRYVSATTFIGQFFEKFDAPAVANRIAAKRGTTPEKLLADWQREGDRGRREGTHVHAFAEAVMTGSGWISSDNVRETLLFNQVVRAAVALLKRFEFVAAEEIVFSPQLGIAGTVDLIMRDRSGQLVLFDWKQNKKIDRDNKWDKKALPPINHMDDCDFNKYALQLSLYWRIIHGEDYRFGAGAKMYQPFRGALIHLTENDYRTIKLPLMADEIISMVEDF